ncbi:glycosyltransferase family 4 protein [Kineococcus glutinatus]|uniref:glycosyltransferase family 4 protein n=1 Tax=Kineococcus glutinatus TaxID=1070872 RepID=UPI0031F17F45
MRGRGRTGPVCVEVVYPSERDVALWQRRHAAGEVPNRWPYGLDRMGGPGVDLGYRNVAAAGRARTALQRGAGLVGLRVPRPRGGARRIGLAWDENAAQRMVAQGRYGRMHAGAIWVSDALREGRRDAVTRARLRALRSTDGVWCLSRAQLEPLREQLGTGGPPVSFVRFGVDPDFYRYRDHPGRPVVVSVGGDRDRDAATLFAALAEVVRARPDAEVVVQTTSALRPPPGVRTERYLTHLQLRDLYARASVVAIATRPNLHVSGMTVSLEAMATGRPVVITGSPGMEDYVTDGENGFVVPTGSAAALAERVVHLLAEPDTAREVGRRGRAAVEAGMTSGHLAQQLLLLVGAAA